MFKKIRPLKTNSFVTIKASTSTKGRGGGAIMEGKFWIYRGKWN